MNATPRGAGGDFVGSASIEVGIGRADIKIFN